MTDKIYYPQPILPVGNPYPTSKPAVANKTGSDFRSILESKVQKDLKFSAHALQRLQKRGITLGKPEMAKLENAVKKAEAKGAKEALVIMDNLAMVVSIKNRTVITAVGEEDMKDNVFTNIDTAVIV